MQHFGGADAVDHLAAEVRRPALADVAGQGFTGRRTQPQRHLVARGQVGAGQHAAKPGGRAIEHRRLVVHQALEHGLGGGALGHQQRGGADAQRESQRVAQPVGEEQFGGGEHRVFFRQAQHRLAVQFGGPVQVGLGVHRALGFAGGAGRIQPECRLVGVGVGGIRQALRGQHGVEGGAAVRQRGAGARHHHRPDFVPALSQRGLQRGQQRGRHQRRLRAAVAQHEGVVVGGEQGVHSHRHHARVQRAQKRHRPVGAVVHQQQHAVLAPQADRPQTGCAAADLVFQLAVGQCALVIDQGGLVGPAGVVCDEMGGKVEACGGRVHHVRVSSVRFGTFRPGHALIFCHVRDEMHYCACHDSLH